jgi:ribose transport system permease protein/putative xylitol transport system permease protein
VPLALIAAMVAGGVNGVIFTKFKIPSFLVTLGMLSILHGISLILSDGSTISYRDPSIRQVALGEIIPSVPNLVIWGLLLYIFTIFLARRTKFGRYTYAIGENERVVDLSGVDVDRYKIYAFVLSGLLCGVAGVLTVSRIGSASPVIGDGLLLPSIAAIVMGGTTLSGGMGGPFRTLLGVLVIAVLQNGMVIMSIHPFVQEIILGMIVILAVAMSMDRRKIDIIK